MLMDSNLKIVTDVSINSIIPVFKYDDCDDCCAYNEDTQSDK